jgi:regulatory protein
VINGYYYPVKITDIQTQKRNRNRLSVYVDGKYSFSLDYTSFSRSGLHVGDSLSGEQVQALSQNDEVFRGRDYALDLLSRSERTEHELKTRLFRKGFSAAAVRKVIQRLKETGLIDDRTFAQHWVDELFSSRPMGRMRAEYELRRKHVDSGIFEDVCGSRFVPGAEQVLARKTAEKKLGALAGYPQETARRRLHDYLKSRGFEFEIIYDLMEEYFGDRFS